MTFEDLKNNIIDRAKKARPDLSKDKANLKWRVVDLRFIPNCVKAAVVIYSENLLASGFKMTKSLGYWEEEIPYDETI